MARNLLLLVGAMMILLVVAACGGEAEGANGFDENVETRTVYWEKSNILTKVPMRFSKTKKTAHGFYVWHENVSEDALELRLGFVDVPFSLGDCGKFDDSNPLPSMHCFSRLSGSDGLLELESEHLPYLYGVEFTLFEKRWFVVMGPDGKGGRFSLQMKATPTMYEEYREVFLSVVGELQPG